MALAPFVRTDGPGFHPTIDRDALLAEFATDRTGPGLNLTSAARLAAAERARRTLPMERYERRPCDLFLWGIGPAPDPRITRIGGVPWLPRGVDWPDLDGVVPTFLCQFDFRDSRDLVGELPGDILLVFVADEGSLLLNEPGSVGCRWVSADASETITADEMPEPSHPFEFVRAWGARYRTCDYLFEPGHDDDEWIEEVCVLAATKVGGIPFSLQLDVEMIEPGHLCQLVSLQACGGVRWPWTDHEAPMKSRLEGAEIDQEWPLKALFDAPNSIYRKDRALMIGDMGQATFYANADHSIRIASDCA